ncbi:hypothetical protein ACLHZ0_21445 [Aeromonas salmonicida]|uniref:hypothetical protein n=1 Tax=Aeromonas salmonicida TaxID=645 RepID=UPI003D054824
MKFPFLSGFALGGVLTAAVSVYVTERPAEIKEPLDDNYTSSFLDSCSFGVVKADGITQAVDWNVLQSIGFLEKYDDGTIALISPSGYAGNVTKCFQDGELKRDLPEITPARY